MGGYMGPDELELLAMQMAANQYGSGPEYMGAEENPYGRSAQRLNYWQDIEQLIGVPLTQLAGTSPGPVDQEPPDVFQSDLGAAYGSNPVFADAFELIQGGVDPYKAMAAVRQKYEAGKYGDESLVPQKVDEFTGQTSVDWDEVGATVQQFATDNARTSREMEQYQTENTAAYSEAVPDGARYANAPLGGNDPFAFANEGDLYDFDAIQSDFNQMSSDYRNQIGADADAPGFAGGPMGGVRPRNTDLKEFDQEHLTNVRNQTHVYNPARGRRGEASAPGSSGGRMVNVNDKKGRGAFDPIRQGNFEQNRGQRQFNDRRAEAGRRGLANAEGDAFQKSLNANLSNRRDRANKTAVRSDANTNTMKRLMAAYALIHGEMPG